MRWLLLAFVMLQTATCGQTGPLTQPPPDDQTSHAVPVEPR